MRTRRGYVFRSHSAWFVRYPECGKQHAHRLASVRDYPKKTEVQPLADEHMVIVNKTQTVEAAGTVAEFFDSVFLPACELRLSEHAIRNYRMCWNRLKPQIGSMRLRDVRTFHVQQALDAIHRSAGEKIGHSMFRLMKVTCSALFAHALRLGHVVTNPAQGTSVRGFGHSNHRPNEAYSIAEVRQLLMLVADNPQVAAVVGTFAFLGLRNNEAAKLQAEDYKSTNVRVWRDTKTGNNELVPVIAPLRKLLDAVKPEAGDLLGISLDEAEKVVRAAIEGTAIRWLGWYGFRRGLATNLYELGVPVEVAALILRNTPQIVRKRYLKLQAEPQKAAAMARLEQAWEESGARHGVSLN